MSDTPTPPTPDTPPPATPMQRILMDRAREQAARDQVKPPRRPGQIAMSVVFALVVVFIIGGAINAFLAAMQRTMRVMDEQEKAEEAKREADKLSQPMPTYVVPDAPAEKK